jgi:hypothetical protein
MNLQLSGEISPHELTRCLSMHICALQSRTLPTARRNARPHQTPRATRTWARHLPMTRHLHPKTRRTRKKTSGAPAPQSVRSAPPLTRNPQARRARRPRGAHTRVRAAARGRAAHVARRSEEGGGRARAEEARPWRGRRVRAPAHHEDNDLRARTGPGCGGSASLDARVRGRLVSASALAGEDAGCMRAAAQLLAVVDALHEAVTDDVPVTKR